MIALLDQTYLGVKDPFDNPVCENGYQKWVAFSETFWHVDCVRKLSQDAFPERYRKWCKQHWYHFSPLRPFPFTRGRKNWFPLSRRTTSRSCSSSLLPYSSTLFPKLWNYFALKCCPLPSNSRNAPLSCPYMVLGSLLARNSWSKFAISLASPQRLSDCLCGR